MSKVLALSSLNSQPVPGWTIKSNVNNSNSQSEDIELGVNTSEDKNNQNKELLLK